MGDELELRLIDWDVRGMNVGVRTEKNIVTSARGVILISTPNPTCPSILWKIGIDRGAAPRPTVGRPPILEIPSGLGYRDSITRLRFWC